MKILLFCAKAFETMEFSPFVDIFGWAADEMTQPIEVITGGFTRRVVSTFGIPIEVQVTLPEIRAADYDALAIPGGFEEYGFYEEVYDERFLALIREFDRLGKPIASVCVAALPIGKSGVLVGRNATTYHLDGGKRQGILASFGVDVIDEPIVIDGNIITSYCPETAPGVAFALLEKLAGHNVRELVQQKMGF